MLTNRLVRALVGAVIAQASVAAAWYVYKKEQSLKDKVEQDSSEDLNSLENTPSVKTVEVTDGSEATQSPEMVATTEVSETEKQVVASKPKRVRKPKVTKKEVPNATTVAAMQEAEQIVQAKKSRRTTPVKKDMFVAPTVEAKPARKRTPAAKKAEPVVEPQVAQKPARKRASKKQA